MKVAFTVLLRYLLSVCHAILCFKTIFEMLEYLYTMMQMYIRDKNRRSMTSVQITLLNKPTCTREGFMFLVRSILSPVMVGFVLYGNHHFKHLHVRSALAFSLIITSNHFMTYLARFPSIGNYVFMLSKVSN